MKLNKLMLNMVVVGTALSGVAGSTVAHASPDFAIDNVQANAYGGVSEMEAGKHPTFQVKTTFTTSNGGLYTGSSDNQHSPQTLSIEFPSGMMIDANDSSGRTACTRDQLNENACPADAELGTIKLKGRLWWISPVPWPIWGWGDMTRTGKLYRMSGTRHTIGYSIPGYATSSYGPPNEDAPTMVDINNNNEHRFLLRLELFNKQYEVSAGSGRFIIDSAEVTLDGKQPGKPGVVTLPTRCDRALTVNVRARSYSGISDQLSGSSTVTPSHCDTVKFDPTVNVYPKWTLINQLINNYRIITSFPHEIDRSRSAVARMKITLPPGIRLGGLLWNTKSCTLAEFKFIDPAAEPDCSDSIISSVDASIPETADKGKPASKEAGFIYLGHLSKINDQTFSHKGKIFIWMASEPRARQKLIGDLTVRRDTGQVEITFGDRNENSAIFPLPWDHLELSFIRLLVTPPECEKEAAGSIELTPWADAPTFNGLRDIAVPFTLDAEWSNLDLPDYCPPPRLRSFQFDIEKASSDFSSANKPTGEVDLQLRDPFPRLDQDIRDIEVDFPKDMKFDVSSARPCLESDILADKCSADSILTSNSVFSSNGISFGGSANGKIYATKVTPTGIDIVSVFQPSDANSALQFSPRLIRGRLETTGPSGRVELHLAGIPDDVDGFPTMIDHLGIHLKKGVFTNPPTCAPSTFELKATSQYGVPSTDQKEWQATDC